LAGRSRSASASLAIARCMLSGSVMSLISTAVTWVPQGSVWVSMTFLIWSLMLAVSESSWSRLKRPTTLRTVVWLIWLIAL
jgi:hypothetical protein